jgi:hypothetical protein
MQGLDETPSLFLLDKGGVLRAALNSGLDGSVALSLWDEKSNLRAALGAIPHGQAEKGSTEPSGPFALTIFAKDGKVIERLPK